MKFAIYTGSGVCGLIAGYVPTLFGASPFDLSSLFWGFVGSLVGLWVGYKAGKYFEL